MDRAQATDAAIAQWAVGADSDGADFHNLQYNTDRDTPSVFGFNEWNELHVSGWEDETNYPVVGLETEGDAILMSALEQDDGSPVAKCTVSVTEDGLCPVRCTVDDHSVNAQQGTDNLWSLLSDGTDAFTNYLYSAEDGWQASAHNATAAAKKVGQL
jgi:hypothetical protein